MNAPAQLILASTSPRRSQLLEEAAVGFRVITVPVEEVHVEEMPLVQLTRLNAELKARSVAAAYPQAIVIGADTLVSVDGMALGKPASLTEAHVMIRRLAGRAHEVGTAVCLVHEATHRAVHFVVVTRVVFRALTDSQIDTYLSLIHPLDKAGGYAAQDHGDMIIDHFEGSLSNVVGLPMERLLLELALFQEALSQGLPC
jgi:septum formation protein